VFDAFDYFLISAFITSILASHLKNYLSEKVSMARLKNAIIKESRLIKPSKVSHFYSKKSRLKRIYRVAFNTRGGQVEFELAEQIKDVVIKLTVFLKKKEMRARVLKFIFTQGRLVLHLVLHLCKRYIVIDEVNPQIAVIACCTGGATGFVCSWFSVGAVLFTPPTILSFFLLRSLIKQI
jgi:hypothetical protein